MAFRFAAILLLSINAPALAVGLVPIPDPASDVIVKDQSVVRTHDSHQEQPAQVPEIPSPVLRVHHHTDAIAIDGKGVAETLEKSEPGNFYTEAEVPPVEFQDTPRTPVFIKTEAALNQSLASGSIRKDLEILRYKKSLANESAPSPVVRVHAAAAAPETPKVSEVVDVTGEVQSKTRSRTRKQGASKMDVEEASETTAEAPEIPGAVEDKVTVRAEPHPTALAETSGQWPPRGAAAETHVVLVMLSLGLAGFILASAGVCGSFKQAETKALRTRNDMLADVYASASPGIAATPGTATTENMGTSLVPIRVL